jgi:N-acetylglucosamine-6-sulfatase
MPRRSHPARLCFTAALAGAIALATASPVASALPRQTRPNVLVIMTDDQALGDMRVMASTRHLLGSQGTTFDDSIVSFSQCCPSRATFLSGQYPHNHQVLANTPPFGGFDRFDNRNTLAVWLRRAGYYTALVGKYLNGYGERDRRQVPPGWSSWNGSVDRSTYHYYRTTINRNGRLLTTGTGPASYQTDVYSRLAASIIRARARSAQPFFLWVTPLAPHSIDPEGTRMPGIRSPVPAPRDRGRFSRIALPMPPSFNEADVSDKPLDIREAPALSPAVIAEIRANYQRRLESLLDVDRLVAHLVATLRATGELERTLIIFTSDNGFFNGEHRVPEGKHLVYEPSIRVPLILRGPGVPRGAHRGQLVANIDLAPTILQAARARPGRLLDGISLLPLARTPRLGLGRSIEVQDAPDDDIKEQFTAVRTPDFLYAEYRIGDRELYDLRQDPFELQNRAGDPAYGAIQASLAARLAALRSCRGAGCR